MRDAFSHPKHCRYWTKNAKGCHRGEICQYQHDNSKRFIIPDKKYETHGTQTNFKSNTNNIIVKIAENVPVGIQSSTNRMETPSSNHILTENINKDEKRKTTDIIQNDNLNICKSSTSKIKNANIDVKSSKENL